VISRVWVGEKWGEKRPDSAKKFMQGGRLYYLWELKGNPEQDGRENYCCCKVGKRGRRGGSEGCRRGGLA